MDCPICNFSELNEGAATCPKCQSDIEVFSHLDKARKQHLFQKKTISVLVLLLAIVAVGWGAARWLSGDEPRENTPQVLATENSSVQEPAVMSDASTPPEAGLKQENETLTAEITSLKNEIKSLNEKLNASGSSPSGGTIIHEVKNGESLWRIAAKYYGDGFQYKKIVEDNGLSDPQSIRIGTKLKIIK